MSIKLKIIGIISSLILLSIVFYLLRKKRLKESYSIFWGIIAVLTVAVALGFDGVIKITKFFDIDSPINGVFFVAFFLLAILSLYFSVKLTEVSRKIKVLAQENAIFKERLAKLENDKNDNREIR